MRTLSANALEKLKVRLGNEPVVIIEIQWSRDGSWLSYADRDIGGIVKGKILELSDLDDVVAISDNNNSQEIQITFDDTDGSIKAILDSTDIHKRDVRVWQWFEGLAFTDKFLLFCGKINSPITWSEGEQTVSFSIVSQIEDKEFGFSPEEGQFPYIPVELIGKAWPSCFGTPLDLPCVAIGKAVHATSLAGIGILSGDSFYVPDPARAPEMGTTLAQMRHASLVSSCWLLVNHDEFQKWENQRKQNYDSWNDALWAAAQAATKQQNEGRRRYLELVALGHGTNPVRILGGEKFPRNQITLDIGGGLFTGYFGSTLEVDDDLFTITSRYHPENEALYADELAKAKVGAVYNPGTTKDFDFYSAVPCGRGDFNDTCNIRTYGYAVDGGNTVSKADTVVPKHFWADSGAAVTLYGPEPITYIVSIVPGTVLAVKAFKTFNGVQHLVAVPSDYYYVETKTYGSITAVQVVFYKTLSTIPDQKWGDDVYVTFQSSVGPDIVEILEYIIDTYTEFAVDTVSFDHVRDRLEPFPANFAVLDRKNVMAILQEIAYQARCSLRLINGIFYLTYLPEEPTAIDTLVESDVEFNSITVSGSPTEDVVTKLVAEWRISYAQPDLNKLILRHNVGYYGVQEETTEFYIYNQPDIILKVATFWLIRKANTWKHINLRTFLPKLNVETLDCIILNFEKAYVTNGPVKAVVKKANFNSVDQIIDMECWLPVKFGTLVPYDFAWPADTPAQWIYPTNAEVRWGHSGSDWIGEDAEGALPVGLIKDTLDTEKQTISGGGHSASRNQHTADNRNHDAGDRHPSDQDFNAQAVSSRTGGSIGPGTIYGTGYYDPSTGRYTVTSTGDYHGSKNPISKPIPGLQNVPLPDPKAIPLPSDGIVLDLNKTKVRDSGHGDPDAISYLQDVLRFDVASGYICLRNDVWIMDVGGTNPASEFDFQYDEDGAMWGAGTAWLKPA